MEYRNGYLHVYKIFVLQKNSRGANFFRNHILRFLLYTYHISHVRPAFTGKQLVPALTLRLGSSFRI